MLISKPCHFVRLRAAAFLGDRGGKCGSVIRRSLSVFQDQLWNEKMLPGERLAAAVMRSSPKLINAAASDPERQEELIQEVYGRLNLERPAVLKTQYDDMKSYSSSLTSLVLEETRHSIVSAFNQLLKEPSGGVLRGITIEPEFDDGPRDLANKWYELWTHKPLTKANRNNLRAGAVVGLVCDGHELAAEQVILGTIHFGSRKRINRTCGYA